MAEKPIIITIGTLKGGPGKTTEVFNLSALLAEKHPVLAVDADPQFNLTANMRVNVMGKGIKTIKNVFEGGYTAEEVIYKSPIPELPNLDIIPSSIELIATELNIVNLAGREHIFNNFILDNWEYLKRYKYIIIDTNPNLGMINQNVLFSSDHVILVSSISLNSIMGAELFIALWTGIRQRLRKLDNVAALALNNYDGRAKKDLKELLEYIDEKEDLRDILLKTIIPTSAEIKRTETRRRPINLLGGKKAVREAKAVFFDVIADLKERGIL
ncbi:MAG: AAA family ATPase [Oscillospiraceae bacterium]|nr:AAA family ATPase [Oscillospiraceae bacterium]